MKKLLLYRALAVILLLCTGLAGWCQPADLLWERRYDGLRDDYAADVAALQDGGFIVVGYTFSYMQGSGHIRLLRTDGEGDTVWTRVLEQEQCGIHESEAVCVGRGQSIFVLGSSGDYGLGWSLCLMRLDSAGTVQSTHFIAYSDSCPIESGNGLGRCADGGFIISGSGRNSESDGFGMVVKTDSVGNVEWTYRTSPQYYASVFYDAHQTPDGGYIAAGEDFGPGTAQVVKLNAAGEVEWYRHYMLGYWHTCAYSVCPTSDGGYIVGGQIDYVINPGKDALVMKLASNGDTLWTKSFGLDEAYHNPTSEEIRFVAELRDGSCAALGTSTELRLDGDIWKVIAAKYDPSGGAPVTGHYDSPVIIYGGALTQDQGLVGAGWVLGADSIGRDALVRIGALLPASDSRRQAIPTAAALYAYPNPFNNELAIRYDLPRAQPAELAVYNLLGQKVATLYDGMKTAGTHAVTWAPQTGTGIYFVRLETADAVRTSKVVYLR